MIFVALLGALGITAGLALASSGPPAPTITAKPADPSTSNSARFSFADTQTNISFLCSLDGSPYAACTTGKSYSALGQGQHTFSVEAKSASGDVSSPTSYSWTIDRAAPSITISFPANGTAASGPTWNATCNGGGVCGTASDPSGVASVAVSVQQNATGKYWDGTAYSSSGEEYQTASLSGTGSSANWSYILPVPAPDGRYTLHVRASDALGNTTPSSTPAHSAFQIDTTPPPAPTITSGPADPTSQTTAKFIFADSASGVTYLCKLDGGSYAACPSPKSYSGLNEGAHTFSVEARDSVGNISAATSYRWIIDTTPPPAPAITEHPNDPTAATAATFGFSDTESGVRFQCRLDASAWQSCTSPNSYSDLSVTRHTFYVRALDAAQNISSVTKFAWTIQAIPFTIAGDVPSPLYPGMAPKSVPLTLTNSNSVPIYVTGLTVRLTKTNATGCTASWFQIGAANVPSAGIMVPANGSVSVPTDNDPTLKMIESGTNQDACKGAVLTLSYSGRAHS